MIRREDVVDLQPGDVVEVTSTDWPDGTVLRGPLWMLDGETLQVGSVVVRHWDGRHPFNENLTLTVVSRAPRPLYVNHPRTKPVPGDVVAYAGPTRGASTVTCRGANDWVLTHTGETWWGGLPEPLRLLVDGETGRCVP